MKIRVSRGVGSSPKMWAVADRRTQVGEFDVSADAGRIEGDSMTGMSGIVWKRGSAPCDVYPRKLYASVEEWVDDLRHEYPGAEIVRADHEPQNWL
jgi:hypothetical protein